MARKMFFRVSLAVVLLAAFSLSCKLVDNVSELRSYATQAQGMATEINAQGIATSIQGLATEIDAPGMATSVQGLATEIDMGGLLTALPGIDLGGVLTGTEVVATPNGFPTDIPLLQGDLYDMSGSPTLLEYTADTNVKAAVEFYRREMTTRGWVEAAGSNVTNSLASLTFQNGSRVARIKIEEDFIMGVIVKITLQ